jgi:hypothetical protein
MFRIACSTFLPLLGRISAIGEHIARVERRRRMKSKTFNSGRLEILVAVKIRLRAP